MHARQVPYQLSYNLSPSSHTMLFKGLKKTPKFWGPHPYHLISFPFETELCHIALAGLELTVILLLLFLRCWDEYHHSYLAQVGIHSVLATCLALWQHAWLRGSHLFQT